MHSENVVTGNNIYNYNTTSWKAFQCHDRHTTLPPERGSESQQYNGLVSPASSKESQATNADKMEEDEEENLSGGSEFCIAEFCDKECDSR